MVGVWPFLPLPPRRHAPHGYVDEVLFGYEVVERLPALVERWIVDLADQVR